MLPQNSVMHEMILRARISNTLWCNVLANLTYLLSTQLSKIVSFSVHSDKTSNNKYKNIIAFIGSWEILEPLQCGFLSVHNISNQIQST